MPDTFSVRGFGTLSNAQIDTLSLLYLPLIKPDGLALYHFLASINHPAFDRSLDYPVSYLWDTLNINPERFLDVRRRLEASHLIDTYDDDAYVFVVHAPISAAAFFKSPLLAYLKTEIPKERIQDIKQRLLHAPSLPAKKTKISATFEHVFGPLKGQFPDSESLTFKVPQTLDVKTFLERIPHTWISAEARTSALSEMLTHIAYVYGLDDAKLKAVIQRTVAQHATLDFDHLSDQAAALYLPEEAPKTLDLDAFKKTHPADVLKVLTGSHVPAAELKIVDRLIRESGLKLEVISVLLAYVITELNGQMPVYKYFERVSGQWHRNHILTAEDAIAHIKASKAAKKAPKKTPKEAPTIDWFKDYVKTKDAS